MFSIQLSYPIILLSIAISFLATLVALPFWIKRAKHAGLAGKDMHKLEQPLVAELGGIIVFFGFLLGALSYIALDVFYLKYNIAGTVVLRDLEIIAALLSIAIITIVGVVDDILGWKIGLRQWQKPLIVAFASLPMMVINAGNSGILLPGFGWVDVGHLFPLFFIPVAISGAANGFNMLAGYNGLEAGMGIIILSALAYMSWLNKAGYVAVIALCMVAALIAFFFFNRYPAKVFPGDTLTYSVGGTIAIIAILGNVERFALFIFFPYFVELVLKARGFFRKESFAKVLPDGSLEAPYEKVYGLEHLVIKILKKCLKRVTEKDVVTTILALEAFLVCIAFIWRG